MMMNALATVTSFQNFDFFFPTILWKYQCNRIANRLRTRIAEQLLSALVPGHDNAIVVLTDDGILTRFHDSGQTALTTFNPSQPHDSVRQARIKHDRFR